MATSRRGRPIRRRARVPQCVLALAVVACTGVGCSGSRPTLADTPESVAPVVTASTGTANDVGAVTTTLGRGPTDLDRAAGLQVDVDQPCRALSRDVLALLGAAAAPEPRPAGHGRCEVTLAGGDAEVVATPFGDVGRKPTFEAYIAEHEPAPPVAIDSGRLPAVYFAPGPKVPRPVLALFPDNAMVQLRLPEPPPDESVPGLTELVVALEESFDPA
jgi:hypothetical protein